MGGHVLSRGHPGEWQSADSLTVSFVSQQQARAVTGLPEGCTDLVCVFCPL